MLNFFCLVDIVSRDSEPTVKIRIMSWIVTKN